MGFQRRPSGLALIEILIAATIATLLLSILMTIYLTAETSMRLQSALYETQDNAKMAISLLTTEIHKAGNIGCAKLTKDFPILPYHEYNLQPDNRIYAQHDNEIFIRYADYPHAVLLKPMTGLDTLLVDKTISFNKGDILMVANCKRAELFAVRAVRLSDGGQEIKTQGPLHDDYEKNSEVSLFAINHFYVAKTNRKNQAGKPIYALYLSDIQKHRSELVAGIQQIRFSYTIKQAGKWMDVPSNAVSDWSLVVGAKADLDVVSPPLQKTWHLFAVIQGQDG